MKKSPAILVFLLLLVGCEQSSYDTDRLRLHYRQPASNWNEALPVGNGRLGAMVFGTVTRERIQFNEETLWTGAPHDYAHPGAVNSLSEIRRLIFDGQPREAERLAMERFMSIPLGQKAYQPFGDLYLEFPGHDNYVDYERSLDLTRALTLTRYQVRGITYTREVFASHPDQVLVVRLTANQKQMLNFSVQLDSPHEAYEVSSEGNDLQLIVRVRGGSLHGLARLTIKTDGQVGSSAGQLDVSDAGYATLYLAAATSFVNYRDVSGDPQRDVARWISQVEKKTYKRLRKEHISDYQSLFNRFFIDFGTNGRDTMPMDLRLSQFNDSPADPSLIALYVQFGRYLMISSSRSGTQPANLQGIWNDDLEPAWESKYTTNINAEMNYWLAESANLSECHDPLFRLIEECAETGSRVAREHYGADGWILHHNTDIWRGTAPINHANHGIWQGGSGWLCHHLWEHFLYTRDTAFLRERAWPLMREAARFYMQVLVQDPQTGWLISSPSNSPEIGGLVAGPTMDHQIIRSLFGICVETTKILQQDEQFAARLKPLMQQIAPNQIGRLGQLQEWMEDIDDPEVKHRHVSHLWGMHPGADITWERTPELMEAARQSLLFRGDDGTGWSLAWKINFWARFFDGDHAYELIKLLFRVKDESTVNWSGGSYINLFDAHPPFQIDGNFGAPAGIIELLVQSHQGFIDLLPALPAALPEGQVRGVCARGAFELDMTWEKGELKSLKVLSRAGLPCRLRYQGKIIEFDTKKGLEYESGKDFSL